MDGGLEASGAPWGASGAVDGALAEAVRTVLGWASADVARFTGLLTWLWSTAYHPRIPADAAGRELVGVGLGGPALAPLRTLLAGLRSRAEPAALARGLRHGAEVARTVLRALPADDAARPRVARFHAALLVQANVLVPGTLDFTDVDEAVARPERDPAAIAAWPGPIGPERFVPEFVFAVRVAQTGDLAGLDRLAAGFRRRIGAVQTEGTTDGCTDGSMDMATDAEAEAVTPLVRRDQIALLAQAFADAARLSGSLQDSDAAVAVFRELQSTYQRDGAAPPPLLVIAAVAQELGHACRSPDPTAALRRLIAELEVLYAGLPPGHELRWMVAGHLGDAHYELGVRTGDPAALHAAARCAREVAGTGTAQVPLLMTADFPLLRAMALTRLVAIEPDAETVERAVTEVHRVVTGADLPAHRELHLRYALARALLPAADRLDDPGLLDQCVEELQRAVALQGELSQRGEIWPRSAESVALLSEAYWKRGRRHPRAPGATDRDLELALTARSVALNLLPHHVLTQYRTEHRLAVTRTGSAHALWLAYWNLAVGRTADAVSALERGRALVLRAATASHGLSERLTATGQDLAARHRELLADLTDGSDAVAALLNPTGGPQFSIGVWHTMSTGLMTSAAGRAMLEAPGVPDLAAGLLAAGADALVYLLPGAEPGLPGFALTVRAGPAGPAATVLKLPLLASDNATFQKYLDAAAQRSRYVTDPTVHESWQAAWEAHWRVMLNELCDWAWQAVMGEVLAAVGAPAGTPRIVLVPCGPLGAVPWHAARTAGAPGTGRSHHYACEDAVITYAASGSQFLRAVARERMPADGIAVLVDDPELSLVWAGIETDALRASCYPDARRYGAAPEDDSPCEAAGTPDDLLATLPGGSVPAAVLHVACHGLAGPSPTRSALWLAEPPGGGRDSGRLTVARILDGAAQAPHAAAFPKAGPLVVLSGCETDLSTRDHDEALTLATALVARGAADVVGTRWVVDGSATALMTTVFHHARTAHGLAPADALRAAQLWMLDPGRELPPAVDGILRDEATRSDLHHPYQWAGLTHQGNPSPPTGHDDVLARARWMLHASRAQHDRRSQASALAVIGAVLRTERRWDEAVAAYDAALAAWPDGADHPDHRRVARARVDARVARWLARLPRSPWLARR